jgi:hypothetical protein
MADPSPESPAHVTVAPSALLPRRTRAIVNGVLAVALVVLVGGVAFAAGRATAPATAVGNGDGQFGGDFQRDAGSGGFRQFPGGPNGMGGAMGGDARPGVPGTVAVQGKVMALTGDTLTLQLLDGSTIEVAIGADTVYHRRAGASASDVAAGQDLIVELDPGRGAGPGLAARDVTIAP